MGNYKTVPFLQQINFKKGKRGMEGEAIGLRRRHIYHPVIINGLYLHLELKRVFVKGNNNMR